MDQGIIQTGKLKFRKRQLQHIISELEKDKSKCGSELLKTINILQAIYWINRSWQEVESSTIRNVLLNVDLETFHVMNLHLMTCQIRRKKMMTFP